MASTAELAAMAVNRFKVWVSERDAAGDWPQYIRAGKINRSEAATECGFGRSAWIQNGGLATELSATERRLVQEGICSTASVDSGLLPDAARSAIGAAEEQAGRASQARASLEKRLKSVEEQNAALRAANRELTELLRRSAFAELHLARTGRLLPP